MKKLSVIIVLAVLAAGIALFTRDTGPKVANALDSFTKCLTEKGAFMYGADWCPHCQDEKRAFGDSFKYVSYVECPDNPELCLSKKIEGFPTWIFADQRRHEGVMGLNRLSETTACPLPEEYKN